MKIEGLRRILLLLVLLGAVTMIGSGAPPEQGAGLVPAPAPKDWEWAPPWFLME